MINPLIIYKSYHRNRINIIIHQISIPFIIMTFYTIIPYSITFYIQFFYTINFFRYNIFYFKRNFFILYLQFLYITSFVLKKYFSFLTNILIHSLCWILQIIGHKYFEKNSPALVFNLYESLLVAPYFVFLETFYSYLFVQSK